MPTKENSMLSWQHQSSRKFFCFSLEKKEIVYLVSSIPNKTLTFVCILRPSCWLSALADKTLQFWNTIFVLFTNQFLCLFAKNWVPGRVSFIYRERWKNLKHSKNESHSDNDSRWPEVLQLQEVEDPHVKDEVLVNLKATTLNWADTLQRKGA